MSRAFDSPFDRNIDRRGTQSYKWGASPDGKLSEDLLPMWVADMDFQTAPEVLRALRRLVETGVFGYSRSSESLHEAHIHWVAKRQDALLPADWLLYTQGVLTSLATTLLALTKIGDEIIIQPPVYYPFAPLIERNGRRVVENPLRENDG